MTNSIRYIHPGDSKEICPKILPLTMSRHLNFISKCFERFTLVNLPNFVYIFCSLLKTKVSVENI